MTGLPHLDKIQLAVLRRVMPSVIASEIIGVQPMTGPTGTIASLRARYSNSLAAYDGCAGLDCGLGEDMTPSYGSIHAYTVDFPMDHSARKSPSELVVWAVQNTRCAFTYSTVVIGCHVVEKGPDTRIESLRPAFRVWRWSFADQDEAFAFKVRWM